MRARPLMLCWLWAACADAPVVPEVPVAPEVAEGASLYDLPFRLSDAQGREIGLDVHRGHPTVVAMFYASCTQACPLMIGKVQTILDALGPDADARVLLISIDPEHDTPAALQTAAEQHHLPSDRWVLARPAPLDLRPLAALLDVRYAAQADGQMSHNSPLTVLDRDGRISLRQTAITDAKEPVVAALLAAAAR